MKMLSFMKKYCVIYDNLSENYYFFMSCVIIFIANTDKIDSPHECRLYQLCLHNKYI